MVIIEVKDIAKLAGYIKIPSMVEGASTMDMIRQRILYFDLPNQCRKCRRFEHQARTCNTIKNKVQEGVAHHNPLPSVTNDRQPSTCLMHTNAARAKAHNPTSINTHDLQVLGMYQGHTEAKVPRNRTSTPPPPIDPPRNLSGNQSSDPGQWSSTTGVQEDLSMTEPPPSPSWAKGEIHVEAGKPLEEATTPKNKLFFELHVLNCP